MHVCYLYSLPLCCLMRQQKIWIVQLKILFQLPRRQLNQLWSELLLHLICRSKWLIVAVGHGFGWQLCHQLLPATAGYSCRWSPAVLVPVRTKMQYNIEQLSKARLNLEAGYRKMPQGCGSGLLFTRSGSMLIFYTGSGTPDPDRQREPLKINLPVRNSVRPSVWTHTPRSTFFFLFINESELHR